MSSAQSSPITSRPPRVEFTNRFVQPPSELYVGRDDVLFIQSVGGTLNEVLTLRGRLLTPAGEIVTLEWTHAAPGLAGSPATSTFDLQEGFFLGLAVLSANLSDSRGLTFVTVGITRGGTGVGATTQVLFADYVEGMKSPSWPTSQIVSPVSGSGRFTSRLGTDPSAGNEIVFTIPQQVRWRLIAMQFTLLTDATAATRFVRIEIQESAGGLVWRAPANATQSASQSISYSVSTIIAGPPASAGALLLPIPEGARFELGNLILTNTANLQAGDNYSAPRLWIEEWLLGA